MNILYISSLEGGKYTGPIYSVPAQIKSQSFIDNIYWVNLTNINTDNISAKELCHQAKGPQLNIEDLPEPFNHPDLVVFEEFFKIPNCLFAQKVRKLGIPYIIVPRSQMTKQYMAHKPFKKQLASFLMFKKFANGAAGVQFLTENERKDSEGYYTGKSVVIPNGIAIPSEHYCENKNRSDVYTGTFIGRYSIYQKGLDLLLDAIVSRKEAMMQKQVRIMLYGPNDRTSFPDEVRDLVKAKGLSHIVTVNGPVFDHDKMVALTASDFFIHTSRFEGLPMAVLDALSYGVPCLVTDGSNMKEAIEEHHAGWGADTNVDSIIAALDCMLQDIDRSPTMKILSNNAKSLADKYSWNNIAMNTHDQYVEFVQ